MSKLEWETDEYLCVSEYLHHSSDSYDEWQINDSDGSLKYPEELLHAVDNALYEIQVTYHVDKKTLKTYIVNIDGNPIEFL